MASKPAAGKKGEIPKGRSTSRRKKAERPQGATRRPAKRAASSAKGRLPSVLPIFTVWLIVAVVLGGLVYWGTSSRITSRNVTPTDRASIKPPQNSNRPLPDKGEPERASEKLPPSSNRPLPGKKAPERSSIPPQPQPFKSAKEFSDQSKPISSPPLQEAEKLASAAPAQKEIGPPPKPELTAPLAEVAIVIDDFGQNLEIAKKFLSIPLSITFSVLPFQPHSEEIVRLAGSRGHEVILHVPMEPQEYPRINPGRGALFVSMSPDRIQKTLQTVLDAYPKISGVNNHMGSRFTENADSMKIVLAELGRRELYFLDSYTSDRSVGYSLARELNVASRRRDIFLDHTTTEAYVRSQIRQLIRKAKIQGSALAIGHPHDCTYKVLLQEAARFQREGIAVVPSGKLIRGAVDRQRSRH